MTALWITLAFVAALSIFAVWLIHMDNVRFIEYVMEKQIPIKSKPELVVDNENK